MNIESILVQDTNGELAEDVLKINLDKEALSVWLTDIENTNKKVLNFSVNNVRYDTIPNIQGATYATYLTYNGSSGYRDKMFSTVVATDEGIFDRNNVPVLRYDPNELDTPTDLELLDDIVIDIKMYNGTIDLLNYADSRMGYGPLTKGSQGYIVKSRRAFPTKVDIMPNVRGTKLYMDGWYSLTQVIFRDLVDGDDVVQDNYYSKEGKIYKAAAYGRYFVDNDDNGVVIRSDNQEILDDGLVRISDISYEDILFSLNETSGISPQANSVFLHSQVLITEELRYAILQEVIDVACKEKIGCDFMDWQKLQLKRVAASVLFDNGMFEKAQIVMESARAMCLGSNFTLIC